MPVLEKQLEKNIKLLILLYANVNESCFFLRGRYNNSHNNIKLFVLLVRNMLEVSHAIINQTIGEFCLCNNCACLSAKKNMKTKARFSWNVMPDGWFRKLYNRWQNDITHIFRNVQW